MSAITPQRSLFNMRHTNHCVPTDCLIRPLQSHTQTMNYEANWTWTHCFPFWKDRWTWFRNTFMLRWDSLKSALKQGRPTCSRVRSNNLCDSIGYPDRDFLIPRRKMSWKLGPDIRDKPGICFVLVWYLKESKKEAVINKNIKIILKTFTQSQILWGRG